MSSSANKHDLTHERYTGAERAVLVYVELYKDHFPDELTEFKELVRGTGAEILAIVASKRNQPEAKYFVGSGKVQEIRDSVVAHKAELVIFNHDLSPSQERNLEKLLQCRVLDRTSLILDIFSQRARTFEGKLQVELAQLKHLSTRLVRGWTHLERQKGGIGLRGPGETQLETDRRLIGGRIKHINKRLKKVSDQRSLSRRARVRADILTVALVGYTNAGKSTLFNNLTKSQVYVAHQLFATLDPTLRTQQMPPLGKVIFADTVGFIRDLPHDLIAAFRATLEETRQADLLLHVIDANHTENKSLRVAVEDVLTEIEADKVPILQVYNKIDLCKEMQPRIDLTEEGKPWRVWCSAVTGEGVPLLVDAIVKCLADMIVECDILLPSSAGGVRAKLYAGGVVSAEKSLDNGELCLSVRMQRNQLERLLAQDVVKLVE